jgi:hypothetical protein
MAESILLEVGGVVVVLFGLREVFRDIFHPTRSGSLSDFNGRAASILMRHTPLRVAVGPIALVSTIAEWVAILVFGFALVYWGLSVQGSLQPGTSSLSAKGFLRGLAMSLGTFDTFQTFNPTPRAGWVQLVAGIEGLVGISMITASVSWLVLLYPALAHMRDFAKQASVLFEAEQRSGLSLMANLGIPVLMELSAGIIRYRLNVILFPILLNFYAGNQEATISHVLPQILQLARSAGAEEQSSDVRLAGVRLQISLESLSQSLAARTVDADGNDLDKVFAIFQRRNE